MNIEEFNFEGHYCFIERPNGTVIEYNGKRSIVQHFEFHGKYASETGYRSHFIPLHKDEDIEFAGLELAKHFYEKCKDAVNKKEQEEKSAKAKKQQLNLFI